VAEGLSLLGQSPPPDGLLLDLDLPDGRGETLLRRVRDQHLPVRVAVCTGLGDPARWSEVRQLGSEALLRKPIEVADVFAALAG
jgi:DNA-binding NarL/FixJ family response regulator